MSDLYPEQVVRSVSGTYSSTNAIDLRLASGDAFALIASTTDTVGEEMGANVSDVNDHDYLWAAWALERWSDFPVTHEPRPLVLVGPRARPGVGFRSGEAKIAFLSGAVDGDASIPPAVLQLLHSSHLAGAGPLETTRLAVGHAHRSETEFVTDRGRQILPAWRLESDGVDGLIWVLDPDIANTEWRPPDPPIRPAPFQGRPHSAHHGELGPDGRHLIFHFVGAQEHIADYPTAGVIETQTAIVVLPTKTYREPFGPDSIIRAIGHPRSVEVELHDPLGARVLIDLDASPVIVTQIEETGSRV